MVEVSITPTGSNPKTYTTEALEAEINAALAEFETMYGQTVTAAASASTANTAALNAQAAAIATGAPIYAAIPGSFSGVPSPFIVVNSNGTALYTHNGTAATFVQWIGEMGVLTIAGLAAIPAAQRNDGSVRIVQSGIAGKPARTYRYSAASVEFENGESVVKPDDVGASLTDPGRWIAIGSRVRVMLAWGQSNMQQNAPRSIIRDNADPLFPTTPPHPNYTVTDNGDGTYTQTFNGRGSDGVFYYRESAQDIRPIASGVEPFSDGLNNSAIGLACAHYDRTGESVVIVAVAQGSQPIERFLPSSTMTITGITKANPAVVSVSDIRFLPQTVELPIRFTSVGGMTELNTGTYVAKTPTPAWTTYRDATAPVAGSFLLYQDDGTTAVNSTGFGTYTSGGTVRAHHLLDQMDIDVANTLTLLGVSAADFVVGFQGEANGPALPLDTLSTVGGAATYQTYLDKRREFIRMIRDRNWADENTQFLDFELARVNANSSEKPRNDVISALANIDPKWSVIPSMGYEAADLTHIDDHWGHGYFAGGATLAAADNGDQAFPAVPFYIRRNLRFDGTLGHRGNVVLLDEETLDISALSAADQRAYLLNTCFSMRSSKLILPSLEVSGYSLGVAFQVLQWSVTGTTPGESDGNSRIISASMSFTDARTDTVTSGSVTLGTGDLRKPLLFQFLRPSNIYFE